MFYVERLKRVNAKSVVVSSAKNMKSLISLSGRELDDLKKAAGFVNEKLVPASEKAVKDFGKVLKNTGEDLKGLIRQEEVVTDKGFGFSVGNNIKFSDVVSDFKSGVNDVKDNFVKAIKSGDDKATGTVWDYIKVTPSKDGLHSTYYEESAIPRSFEITVGDQKMWVHGNGTKHINDEVMKQMEFTRDPNLKKFSNPTDYINRINDEKSPIIYKDSSLHTAITDPDYYSQLLLTDFQGALEKEISTNGIVYDKLRTSGNWEFKFAKPREEGQLPVIKHAQFNGRGR